MPYLQLVISLQRKTGGLDTQRSKSLDLCVETLHSLPVLNS